MPDRQQYLHMPVTSTQQLAIELIRRRSVTPDDQGCQTLLADRLSHCGFQSEHLRFEDVDNLWAIRSTGSNEPKPLFCFAGHTDVVPAGDESAWDVPPYEGRIVGDMLCGRGAADMKGSIAAMLTATERFLSNNPAPTFDIAWLITSDEEGKAVNGTVKVVEWLQANNIKIDWCLVGEPSSTSQVGDTIKNGRRGSMGARLTIRGIQGHVAYPHLAKNPIHLAAPVLYKLASKEWDTGNQFFPATSFQISNVSAGTGATNVIPGTMLVDFNFRFSTEQTPDSLKTATLEILGRHGVDYELDWWLSGLPFITEAGSLVDAAVSAIKEVAGIETELSTSGGTSDGRFIAPTGAQVLELGPLNATIHQVNEQVRTADLDTLSSIYERILEELQKAANK